MQVSSINLTEVRLSQAALFGRAVLRLNASYESELVCFQCIDTSGKPKELFVFANIKQVDELGGSNPLRKV